MANISEETAWKSIEDELNLSTYWVNQAINDWNVIDYFMKLVEEEPTMDRKLATAKIMRDLELVQAALIHVPEVKNKTATMINLIKKKSLVISTFWEKHSSTLKIISLDHKLYVRKTQALLEEEATNRSTLKRKQASSSSSSFLSKPSKKRDIDTQVEQIEHDGITVPGLDVSLATIIKRKAVKCHEMFALNPDDLTPRQKKIMSAGLSSILDLTDQSFGSQRSIFTAEQWDYINAYFEKRLAIKRHVLDDDIFNTIKIVQNTLNLSADYECAIEYIDKLKQKYSKSDKLKATTYKIIKHILKTMDSYSHLLHHNEKKTIPENEYTRLIWSYILELLFPPEGIAHVVTGESENAYSTESKKEQYPQAKSVHGFRIDIRLVVEIGEEEIDVAAGECAKKNDDNKSINDNAKLLRECKDTIDGLVNNLKNTNDEAMSYMIQITGSSCALSTMHLAANGLYVTKHRYTFNIPHRFDDLISLPEALAQLLTMKKRFNQLQTK
ncbi:hypothetical protein G6F70_003807 [Rhizopus microsporus]|uniref:Uncharacterized protein n=3 Tax=Rhizopus TaxID=4842 RepID=A0A367JK06_RHIAZ|nr:hypothetical protein G6F70_003807 [Rhizopus microsporus]RCH90284.1 hypothetical protein CU097_008008 [Rhizopus azygosporus]